MVNEKLHRCDAVQLRYFACIDFTLRLYSLMSDVLYIPPLKQCANEERTIPLLCHCNINRTLYAYPYQMIVVKVVWNGQSAGGVETAVFAVGHSPPEKLDSPPL